MLLIVSIENAYGLAGRGLHRSAFAERQHFACQIKRAADHHARAGIIADGVADGFDHVRGGLGGQARHAGGFGHFARRLRALASTLKINGDDAGGRG